jgi:hypothetical protein
MLAEQPMTGTSLLKGWIDADPTLVLVVIISIACAAVAYLAGRLRGRVGGG